MLHFSLVTTLFWYTSVLMEDTYSFDLPTELIAQAPADPRDHARLLVYRKKTGELIDDYFYNLTDYLDPRTLVVANNSKVKPCRYLFDGGKMEIFAVESVNDRTVRAMVRPGKKFRLAMRGDLGDGLEYMVTADYNDGLRTINFNVPLDDPRLVSASHVPLPPYIKQNDDLAEQYQTIYAKRLGSLAAPTAGLHFTPELKEKVAQQFNWAEVTLEVGLGTFASLEQKNFDTGTLHPERYQVDADTYELIKTAEHVTAIGTTSLRTLETVFNGAGELQGSTDIFIRPGYEFRRVNSLITNFHLPSTSLLLLVEAFLGDRATLEKIYTHAINEKYRFYSFGDAMLII
jgi:S-adenosylmethionine:tRNA ribosyltransferase-isomerase